MVSERLCCFLKVWSDVSLSTGYSVQAQTAKHVAGLPPGLPVINPRGIAQKSAFKRGTGQQPCKHSKEARSDNAGSKAPRKHQHCWKRKSWPWGQTLQVQPEEFSEGKVTSGESGCNEKDKDTVFYYLTPSTF